MRTDLPRWPRIATAAAAVVGLGVGVAGTAVVVGLADGDEPPTTRQRHQPAGPITLVSYDSCESALEELKSAALPHVGPYGLDVPEMRAVDGAATAEGGTGRTEAREDSASGEGGAAAPEAAAPGAAADDQSSPQAPAEKSEHSGTNVHESGVDEPDLVKTDGRRVVTITNGELTSVNVATRERTAKVPMPGGYASQLLLDGDRALVLTSHDPYATRGDMPSTKPAEPVVPGSQLVLVDLSGAGKVLGTLRVDGDYLDARQIDSVARVVVRSAPRLKFTYPTAPGDDLDRMAERNRRIVESSTIADWLPTYSLDNGGKLSEGRLVECDAVSHPRRYTGSALLTVLTVDLRKELTTGDPMSIAADGDTVYGTGKNLYVADDHLPHATSNGFAPDRLPAGPQRTEVYQFDISAPGRPVHVASGGVEGALLNQYSLSEHEGNLRIATTVMGQTPEQSRSMVTVLTRRGDELALTGRVDGLGKGEQIYSVRFLGDVGHVVTFRQTDPLYTVDLSNPAAPRITGELKITGYSAYLHPIGEDRLLGVGQEATEEGAATGLQVSLFDTSTPEARRVGQYHLPNGYSEVENDPHAFLYWADKGLVVIPVVANSMTFSESQTTGMLVLRVSDGRLDEVGMIDHSDPRHGQSPPRRALVIGDELWTVSDYDMVVSNLDTLAQLGRVTL